LKKRVFSGARPTGRQHLGNYMGAVQNYVALQEEFDCVYCVVDLHALTTVENTQFLKDNTRDMVLDWLAAGMDPERSIIFVQSHVPYVTELHTILSMVTPMSWLTRVTTFKEKVQQQPHNVNYGLLGYPVLMAADITLYKADTVPVGEDQLPHLELTREIVRRFNFHFGPVLVEPQGRLTEFPRVMGIDGVQKMSKSLDNHLELAADADTIAKRVSQMVTDISRVYRRDPGHPEVCNVHTFHQQFSATEAPQIARDCRAANLGCVDCKKRLAANLNAWLDPFRERRAKYAANPQLVWDILENGAVRAAKIAQPTLQAVKDAMGLP
jgi:tryptophanyl-tRNA synthetase